MTTPYDVLRYVEEEKIRFIRLAFYDPAGRQKNISILPRQLPAAFDQGIAVDARPVFGRFSPQQDELILRPDSSTMMLLPWRSMENGVIHMVCSLRTAQNSPFVLDTREVLRGMLRRMDDFGLDLLLAVRFEFYLFECDPSGRSLGIPLDQGGYMDVAPKDKGENIRREICLRLEEMGFDPCRSFHQEGPGQNEIDFHFSEPLQAADEASLFKWIVRTCAASSGLQADFSCRPLKDQPKSSMQLQIRFAEGIEEQKAFACGLMEGLPEIEAFLFGGKEEFERFKKNPARPFKSRIRIPALSRDVLEICLEEPLSNPYLGFALLLAAGMEGIEKSRTRSKNLNPDLPEDCGSSWVENLLDPQLVEAWFALKEKPC